MSRDLGDFQTPMELVRAILGWLGPIGTRWPRVLEPTCGRGHFVESIVASPSPPKEVIGLDIQASHVAEARLRLDQNPAPGGTRVVLREADIFRTRLDRDLDWRESGPMLVIGNPPWVTNAELGSLRSENRPRRRNLSGLPGMEAMTGASNFDLAEAVWLKVLTELTDEDPTVALLCKRSVARRVLGWANDTHLTVGRVELVRVNGRRWFGAAVDPCLMVLELGGSAGRTIRAPVFESFDSSMPETVLGFVGGRPVSDVEAYRQVRDLDGRCALTWRQGLKHDAAAVMELVENDAGELRNGLGEVLDVERDRLFPLLKGADLNRGPAHAPRRYVIVTQTRLGEDTSRLADSAPRLWRYLQGHRARFERRRSAIYRNRSPFAMFGLGPYSFAPFKVGVSGLHKTPRFRAIGPRDGRPVMLDDTCYFAACDSPEVAALVGALVDSAPCRALLGAMAFPDAKRPVTKKLLQRIDLRAASRRLSRGTLVELALPILARLSPEISDPVGSLERTLAGPDWPGRAP